MKILMFTPYVPYPPNSGGQTRTFNLIKNLSKKHEITSFSFLRFDHQEPDLSELKKYCSKVEIFRRKKSFSSFGKILKTGFSTFPYLANMYRYDSVKKAIAKELQENKYDLIHLETYYIMPNIPETNVPVLLAEQTIEYLVYQHYAQTVPWWLWPAKPFLYVDVLKHNYWEKYYWKKAKKVVAMSDADKTKMLELVPGLNVDVVPNGVDSHFFQEKVKVVERKNPCFLFQGNFNWLQNREAVDILVEKIWPLIKKKLPETTLWIVGREPTETIKGYSNGNILVSANIEDIRTAYQGADVLVAPLFGGGGTRYKVLEAMASRLPVVSTPIGIEGLGATSGVHALTSNDYQEIADFAVELATNKKKAKTIADAAEKLVTHNFDWAGISEKLSKIYEATKSAKKS